MRFSWAALVLLVSSAVFATDDEWRHQRNYQPPAIRYTREAFDGALRGDFIKRPTLMNVVGNFLANLTPAAIYADTRDLAANFKKSLETGFRDYKKDVVVAAAGFVPVLGETKKLRQAFEAGQAARKNSLSLKTAVDLSLVRKALPEVPDKIKDSFDGPLRMRTFKPGEFVYRSPREAEIPGLPGRFLGTRRPVTQEGAESLYYIRFHGNPVESVRTYQFTRPVTVYYGKVRDGSGYQIFVPGDVMPESVLKWTGTARLQ